MVLLPFTFSNRPNATDIAAALDCPPNLGSGLLSDCNMVNRSELAMCQCRGHLANAAQNGMPTAEALVTSFVRGQIGAENVVESCAVTGPLLVNARNSLLNRPCMWWPGDNSEADVPGFHEFFQATYNYLATDPKVQSRSPHPATLVTMNWSTNQSFQTGN